MALHFVSLPLHSVRKETAQAITLFFTPPQTEEFRYIAGQYLTLRLTVAGETLRRSYSLCSSPVTDKLLAVTVKAVEGGRVSNFLQKAKAGDLLDVLPPLGNFRYVPNENRALHYILLGGGSGITPLMSILKTVLVAEPNSSVSLLYANRDWDSIIFREELENLKVQYPHRLHVEHVLEFPPADWKGYVGRLEGRNAEQTLNAAIRRHALNQQYYICGPGQMMDTLAGMLRMVSVPDSAIHLERFSAPITEDDVVEEDDIQIVRQPVTAILDDKTYHIIVEPDESILDAMMRIGVEPPYSCREGVCCTCRAKVHSGMVLMDVNEALSDQEVEEGYTLTCQTHPLSDDVVVEFG